MRCWDALNFKHSFEKTCIDMPVMRFRETGAYRKVDCGFNFRFQILSYFAAL